MPRFFNRIRQHLAKENRFLQYSRYAIGEILLVVIGILIAIQVDNWNQDRQTSNTEIEYLKRLHSDLANDTAYYNRRIKYADKVIADHKNALLISYTEISSSRDFFESFNKLDWSSEALSIRDNTFSEMNNAGQINIIKNDKLKTELLEFYRQVDVAEKHFEEFNNTTIQFMSHFFIQSKAQKHFFAYEGDWSPWTIEMLEDSDDWQWINDPTSESFKSFVLSLDFYSGKHGVFKEYLVDLRNKSTLLLIEIENEFRNRSIQVPEPSIKPIFVLD
jgi:hypothetical protein